MKSRLKCEAIKCLSGKAFRRLTDLKKATLDEVVSILKIEGSKR
jgi:hypothetical protein